MAKPFTLLVPARQTRRFIIPNHTRSLSSTCQKQTKMNRIITRNVRRTPTVERQQRNMKQSERPDDLGLIPDLLIRPATSDLPSFFSRDYKRRLQIEWRVVFQKVQGLLQLVVQKKWRVPKDPSTGKRIRQPLDLYGRITTARKLHAEFYTALARNNISTIEEIACTGLKRTSQTLISQKIWNNPKKQEMEIEYVGREGETYWLLEALIPSYFKSARIIADRYVQTPLGKDTMLRQVIVLIKSWQTLKESTGQVVKKEKVDEYVVIQQMSNGGEVEPWKVWGTTDPSSKKDIDRMLAVDPTKLTFMERLRSTITSITSKAG